MPCIFSIIRKNKTAFQLSRAPKNTLPSILTAILAKELPAHQSEVTKDLLKKGKIHNMKTQQRTLILYAINFKKVWHFELFYCQFWPLSNLQKFVQTGLLIHDNFKYTCFYMYAFCESYY